MENNFNLADASRVEAEEQLATGKSVVNNQYDSVDEVLGRIENRAAIKIKHLVSFRDAMKAGLKPAFFKFNRKVNSIHVQKLIKSLGDTDMFTLPCYVVPLRPILEKFPDIEVYDSDGNKVVPDSPDLDSYYAVYDGQHRIMACILSGNKDALLEFNAFKGSDPLQRIKEINTTQKGWVGDDYLSSNMAVGKGDVKLYEESAKLQELHGITPTTANSILTFTKNTLRLKDIIEGKDTSKYVEENAQRGIGIFNAAMMRFDGAKEMKRRELIYAVIGAYNDTPDSEKGVFARNMKICMATMSDEAVSEVKALIANKNFGELNTKVHDCYKAFCAEHSDGELDKMEAAVNENIVPYIEKLQKANADKAAKKPLKSGRVHEILLHNQIVEEQLEKDKLAKAQKKAEKATAKANKASKEAKDALAAVDRLKGNDSATSVGVVMEEVIEETSCINNYSNNNNETLC